MILTRGKATEEDFTKVEDFIDVEKVLSILELHDVERAGLIAKLTFKAANFRIKGEFLKLLNTLEKQEAELDRRDEQLTEQARADLSTDHIRLKRDEYGKPLTTIENFHAILKQDKTFAGIRFNEFTGSPEWNGERWTDDDDAVLRGYIESQYKMHNKPKSDDALRVLCMEKERRYNPIIEYIEGIGWDGKERIATLLHKWLRCKDTPYTREVSRLIFAGGINRLYKPGCKFDDVAVLTGKQGMGKSTFIKWLALKDEWYIDITDIEGQKGIEAIEGIWIGEIAEMLAATRVKDLEAVKAYITRQNDRYRRPFEHRVTDNPRRCIFIGTTNKDQFLIDKTGGRRWYPIKCNMEGYDLYDYKYEALSDIRQCWAEAREKFKRGEMSPVAARDLLDDIRREQEAATEDDPREGLIRGFLENKTETCILEIWREALAMEVPKIPSRSDSNDIALILNGMDGWERAGKTKRFTGYGVQKYWVKVNRDPAGYEDLTDLS